MEPVSCSALPASSEPQQTNTDQRPLEVTMGAIYDGQNDADVSVTVENSLITDSAVSCVQQHLCQSKVTVFSQIQATLSSEIMSTIVSIDCWDVLLTAANACSIQLLCDANDGVYIAVGYALHGFSELERILLSLLASIMSCDMTVESEADTAVVQLATSVSMSSVTVSSLSSVATSLQSDNRCANAKADSSDAHLKTCSQHAATDQVTEPQLRTYSQYPATQRDVEPQLKTYSQHPATEQTVAAPLKTFVQVSDIESQTLLTSLQQDKMESLCAGQRVTRSGRLVKSKMFADFTSSDTTVSVSVLSHPGGDRSSLRRQRGQRCRPATVTGNDTEHTATTETSSDQQSVTQLESADTTAPRAVGTADMCGGSVYNGRTRLQSREYEQLMPFKFFCTQCSFMSKREGHMRKHSELHARGVNVLECPMCGYRTTRANHLTRHRLHQHNRDCCVSCHVTGCGYIANSERLMLRHVQIRHRGYTTSSGTSPSSPRFPCTVPGCGYLALTESRLVRHRAKHRAVDGQPSDTNTNQVQHYQCAQCNYKTTQRQHFTRHINSVHNNLREFLCEVCGRRFKRHDALTQHSMVHSDSMLHTDQSQTSRLLYSHRCTMCDRTFRCKSHLIDHESVHSSSRLWQCSVCGASFKSKATHRKHLLTIHTRPARHICLVCGRAFNTSFAMKRHSRLHQLETAADFDNF